MNRIHLTLFSAFFALLCGQSQAAEPSPRPNLVIILSDDMGYADIGVTGVKDIRTPNLDRLAAQGTFCTDAYVTGPICVPSRMGLLTGRHQARWGIYTNNDGYTEKGQLATAAETTLAEHLKKAGYATALFGKWHLSGNTLANHTPGTLPDENGFDEVEMIPGGMDSFWPGTALYQTGGKTVKAPQYLTDHFGQLSADFITRKKGQPFFLALTFNAVHAPLHALDTDIETAGGIPGYDPAKYRNRLEKKNRDPRTDRRIYAAMLEAMDRNVGRVLDTLDSLGLAENTIVAFLNDNGAPPPDTAEHSYNMAGNGPLRGHKFDLWEGGIRTPLLLRWPGRIPAGKRYTGLTSSMDLAATFLTAAGLPLPVDKPLDGVDLMPFLTGKADAAPHASLAWCSSWVSPFQHAALRQGDWKLTRIKEGPQDTDPKWKLFHLAEDIGETTDLAAKHPERLAAMVKEWEAWRSTMPEASPAANTPKSRSKKP